VVGRVKTYEAIVKGHNIPQSGIPESFKVLIKELQSLGLDVKVLDKNHDEIDMKQNFEDDDDVSFSSAEAEDTRFDEDFHYVEDGEMEGYVTADAKDVLSDSDDLEEDEDDLEFGFDSDGVEEEF
ncbi:MAG: hypothetical protein RR977_03635, partial [Oscillospiraceae bacterium]